MRRVLLLLFVAAVVVAAAALAGIGRPDAARGDSAPAKLVTTTGHGVVTAVPDDVTVTAGVQTQATTAADTLSANAESMQKVVAALKQAGGARLQTQQVSLYPRTTPSGEIVGYTAQNSVSAHSGVSGAGALVDAAVAAGANTVDGPSLGLSNEAALYRQALAKALTDAQAKADALGQAGSFTVGPVASVTEQSQNTSPVVFQAAAVGKAAASTPIEPGTQDVTADVTVAFEIQ